MSKPQPKFPDNLAILERADLQSSAADRQKVFPIMSISKSFFGATCALMAVDGEFGEKGIDATLSEVLERAKSQHPNRREQIEEYQQLLRDKDFADVTIAEMLSHRSGFCDASEVKFGDYKGRSRLEFFREQMDRREFRRGEFHYSNEGFTLMEEILNLSSKTGSYEQELQNRILKPLGLVNTGSLYLSPEAMARVGEAVYLQGSEHPIRKVKLEAAERFPGHECSPHGVNSLTEGGLCSTVDELTKYGEELAKMVLGQPNLLTGEAKSEMLEIYGRNKLLSAGQEGYVCGLRFAANQDDGKLMIYHGGGFPANNSLMAITMSCQFDDLKNGNEQALAAAKIDGRATYMQQYDCVTKDKLAGCDIELGKTFLRGYFNSKFTDQEREKFKYEQEAQCENFLVAAGRLPKDFSETRNKIFTAFAPVKAAVCVHLQENFLNADGIIDSAKIAETFKKEDDILRVFREVPEVKEALEQAQKKAEELLPTQEKSASVAASASSSQSFVERLQEARQRADSKPSQGR